MGNNLQKLFESVKDELISGLLFGDADMRQYIFYEINEDMFNSKRDKDLIVFLKGNPSASLSEIKAKLGAVAVYMRNKDDGNISIFTTNEEAVACAKSYRELWQKIGLKDFCMELSKEVEEGKSEEVMDKLRDYLSKVNFSKVNESMDLVSIYEILSKRGKEDSMKTGILDKFDSWTGGIRKGQVYVIGGATGSGKSWMAIQMALCHAFNCHKVLFISTELTEFVIFKRMQKMLPVFTNCTEDEANISVLKTMDKIQMTSRIYELKDIVTEIRRHKTKYNTDIVIIDHVQDISVQGTRTIYDTTSKVMATLKEVALQENIAIIAVSQLSRGSKDSKDQSSAYLGAGKIEQVAHVACVLNNEPNEDGSQSDRFVLNITKNRGNPDQNFVGTGKIKLKRDINTLDYMEVMD